MLHPSILRAPGGEELSQQLKQRAVELISIHENSLNSILGIQKMPIGQQELSGGTLGRSHQERRKKTSGGDSPADPNRDLGAAWWSAAEFQKPKGSRKYRPSVDTALVTALSGAQRGQRAADRNDKVMKDQNTSARELPPTEPPQSTGHPKGSGSKHGDDRF